MNCKKCQRPVADDARFCPHCGAGLAGKGTAPASERIMNTALVVFILGTAALNILQTAIAPLTGGWGVAPGKYILPPLSILNTLLFILPAIAVRGWAMKTVCIAAAAISIAVSIGSIVHAMVTVSQLAGS